MKINLRFSADHTIDEITEYVNKYVQDNYNMPELNGDFTRCPEYVRKIKLQRVYNLWNKE